MLHRNNNSLYLSSANHTAFVHYLHSRLFYIVLEYIGNQFASPRSTYQISTTYRLSVVDHIASVHYLHNKLFYVVLEYIENRFAYYQLYQKDTSDH